MSDQQQLQFSSSLLILTCPLLVTPSILFVGALKSPELSALAESSAIFWPMVNRVSIRSICNIYTQSTCNFLSTSSSCCSAQLLGRGQPKNSAKTELPTPCVCVRALGVGKKSQQETKNVLYVRIKEKSQNLLQIGILRNCRKNVAKQSTHSSLCGRRVRKGTRGKPSN